MIIQILDFYNNKKSQSMEQMSFILKYQNVKGAKTMKRDPIEATKEYKEAIGKIQAELDEINDELDKKGFGMGRCHVYFAKKKELLKREGIDWLTPAECNPYILFD